MSAPVSHANEQHPKYKKFSFVAHNGSNLVFLHCSLSQFSVRVVMTDLWRTSHFHRDLQRHSCSACDCFPAADWCVFVLALNSVYVATLLSLGLWITEGESNSPCNMLLRLQPTRAVCALYDLFWSPAWCHWALAGILNEMWVERVNVCLDTLILDTRHCSNTKDPELLRGVKYSSEGQTGSVLFYIHWHTHTRKHG